MDDLSRILSPNWEAEQAIRDCWDILEEHEKKTIEDRMHHMFKNGLPFKLRHEKIIYIHVFSYIAQLEILGIQIALKFEKQLKIPALKSQLRIHFLDEIFHSMVFSKILYLLCTPYAVPPEFNANVRKFCDFVRSVSCIKIGLVLINLVSESWIEELFRSLYEQNIAPDVFSVILADESRHVSEAELYHAIGLPNRALLQQNLEKFEEFAGLSASPELSICIQQLLGKEATKQYFTNLYSKHARQLKLIHLMPGHRWKSRMQMNLKLISAFHHHMQSDKIELTPLRKLFTESYKNKTIPEMVGQFNVDVSCLDYFKKDMRFNLTLLMLKTLSQLMMENSKLRYYIRFQELFCCQNAFIAMTLKIPACSGHLGAILLKNCHTMSMTELSDTIRDNVRLMAYCYKRREKLEKDHPQLKDEQVLFSSNFSDDIYLSRLSFLGYSGINFTNVGHFGWTQGESVHPSESNPARLVLMAVEKKQIWDPETDTFKTVDILPMSLNVDHRLCDANEPIPKLFNDTFQSIYQRSQQETKQPMGHSKQERLREFEKIIDDLITCDLTLAYQILSQLQSVWPTGLDIFSILKLEKLNIQTLVEAV